MSVAVPLHVGSTKAERSDSSLNSGGLQRKLSIGASNDPFEQEADRVADQVMAMPDHLAEEKTPLRIQRLSGQPAGKSDAAPPSVEQALAIPGRPLEPAARQDIEQRFGHDFSQVQVHSGTAAEQSALDVNANAYTVGYNMVFGKGKYAPGTHQGRWLIAHELAHVVQQVGASRTHFSRRSIKCGLSPNSRIPQTDKDVLRSLIPSRNTEFTGVKQYPLRQCPTCTVSSDIRIMRDSGIRDVDLPPPLNYKRIADQIYEAMAGLGTDEEAVYRALQKLGRNQAAINKLMEVYLTEHGVLLDDIYDEFSGSEREYALQLLNKGTPGSKQRIEAAPSTPLDVALAVARIREAVEGMGTDEEAIFAVLVSFKQNSLELQNEYERLYHEDLRDRLVDELSGSELHYALDLLETPYEHYIHEGNAKLSSAPFGPFGDVLNYCLPEQREMSSGTQWIYWYDKDFWEPDVDRTQHSCKVQLIPGKSAAAAIDEMFEHQDRWQIACAEFVQIVHLYALRHTLGAKRFDERFSTGSFALEVRRRESTGVGTAITFNRKKPSERMVRSDTGQSDPRSINRILEVAPIGSRVRWTNRSGVGLEEPNPWEHENTIKLGPDKFGAHGTASGIFTKSNTHTREEIELLTARGTNPDADASYVNANIFISEIEIFRDLAQR